MLVGKLFRVIVYVKDMQRQVEFYRDVLGFKLVFPTNRDDYAAEHWVTFDTGAVTLALHSGRTGDVSGSAPRFGFEVEDVAGLRGQLLELGVSVEEIQQVAPGTSVLVCQDPEGNMFFLEEHA